MGEEEKRKTGDKYFSRGEYKKALKYYLQLINRNSMDGTLFSRIALSYFCIDEFEKARVFYQKCVEIESNNTLYLVNLALTLAKLGQIEDSIDAFARSLKIDPDNHYAWERLGNLFEEQHQFGEALYCFQNLRDNLQFQGFGIRVRELESMHDKPIEHPLLKKYLVPHHNYYVHFPDNPTSSPLDLQMIDEIKKTKLYSHKDYGKGIGNENDDGAEEREEALEADIKEFQDMLKDEDPDLLNADFLKEKLNALPNPLSLDNPEQVEDVDTVNLEVFEQTDDEFLSKLVNVILTTWKNDKKAFINSFSIYLILYALQRLIVDRSVDFWKNLIYLAPEAWLVMCWPQLTVTCEINQTLFTSDGKFNPDYNDSKKKILYILELVYPHLFSSKFIDLGARIYYKVGLDEAMGIATPFGWWEFETLIPVASQRSVSHETDSLLVRVFQDDDEIDCMIIFPGKYSNTKNSFDASTRSDSYVVFRESYILEDLIVQMDVVKFFMIKCAYTSNLGKLGRDLIVKSIESKKQSQNSNIPTTDLDVDYFYLRLRVLDPNKAREFTRGLVLDLLNLCNEKEFDSLVSNLSTIYELVEAFREDENQLKFLLNKAHSKKLKDLFK